MGAQNLLCATELYRLTYSLPEADGKLDRKKSLIFWSGARLIGTLSLFRPSRIRISMGTLAHCRLYWTHSVESRH